MCHIVNLMIQNNAEILPKASPTLLHFESSINKFRYRNIIFRSLETSNNASVVWMKKTRSCSYELCPPVILIKKIYKMISEMLSLYVCVCACVCELERDMEGDVPPFPSNEQFCVWGWVSGGWLMLSNVPTSSAGLSTHNDLLSCLQDNTGPIVSTHTALLSHVSKLSDKLVPLWFGRKWAGVLGFLAHFHSHCLHSLNPKPHLSSITLPLFTLTRGVL